MQEWHLIAVFINELSVQIENIVAQNPPEWVEGEKYTSMLTTVSSLCTDLGDIYIMFRELNRIPLVPQHSVVNITNSTVKILQTYPQAKLTIKSVGILAE